MKEILGKGFRGDKRNEETEIIGSADSLIEGGDYEFTVAQTYQKYDQLSGYSSSIRFRFGVLPG